IFKTCEPRFLWRMVSREVFPDECRSDPNRTREYQLKAVCAYTLGCASCVGWTFSSGIFFRTLLPVSARSAVGNADSGVRLFTDGEREHQWRGAQFHSQSVLSLKRAESAVWHQAIDCVLFFADDVRRRAHAASQRELGSPG